MLKKLILNPPKNVRLDKGLYNQPGRIYFITICTNFKKDYFDNKNFNKEILQCLLDRRKDRYKIYVYCLMPNHIHFLISTTDEKHSIVKYINEFKGLSTRIAWKYGIKNVLWQKRYYDHILRKEEIIKNIGEYILNNPVRKNLVEDTKDYEFCGLLDEF